RRVVALRHLADGLAVEHGLTGAGIRRKRVACAVEVCADLYGVQCQWRIRPTRSRGRRNRTRGRFASRRGLLLPERYFAGNCGCVGEAAGQGTQDRDKAFAVHAGRDLADRIDELLCYNISNMIATRTKSPVGARATDQDGKEKRSSIRPSRSACRRRELPASG